ncbi:receptor-type tyrosine-protein phosphatase epsilon-like [Pocillopora damicornis]|uniref:receptor-type tyrosine-protein phosphatase epsilon-like n=1 Tax=Pocillopora damicornis TaxID=46731 RepID=UPI000F5544A0|nr:receptor-type tyrosine-protein phosphatase epsilon-like [Pocillopora damicornis]
MTLEWVRPQPAMEEKWKVEYSGKKSYNNSFSHEGSKDVQGATKYTLDNLVPGTKYDLRVYGISKCGNKGLPSSLEVETKIGEPLTPVVPSLTTRKVAESQAEIELWPAEQRNGPISAYQVIVLRVVDGVEELPTDYKSQLDGSNKDGLTFYVAAEIENSPLYEKPWKFTVGDGNSYGPFVNKELKRGDNYIVYQRAITNVNGYVYGDVSKVAKISVEAVVGENEKSEGSGPNAAAVAVPVVLLLLLIPAVVVAVFFYRRRKQSRQESDKREFSVTLNDVQNSPVPGSTGAVYENLNFRAGQEQQQDAVDASPPDDEELVYSQPEDGKPKPIPVNEFPSYYKQKSENGAIVLRDEFKQFSGGMQASWNVGKSNRAKNRYGNITTYDHSRVVLEKIEGDPTSDYINASYIPTYDEKTMCYIATQGPNNVTVNDFWRMIWQENCSTIVMLTNLVELGKTKCEQYWPESNSKLGAITVTLHKTAVFADYIIRTFILVKDSEKREVQQYHYLTWPDRGVPARSSALLGFRYKIHTRHQATGGPLVVHCSAGVGRTGTYIAIDAMLEGAEKIKTVFISNYVQVMRRSRPHMVQKDDQYVFLHQAVVEALTCGNTEIAPQDLRISINKLSRAASPSKNTGFGAEFKRLQFVTDCLSSEEETTTASQPSNIDKNRFPNILPLDTARVRLMSTQPDQDYINASFVDDYKERNAYILTQAPLDNTIGDFWRMTSQYNIGTVVMLNNLKEGKQNYPQYWPGLGSARHGAITVQLLSENTSNNITSRRFSITNNEPPQKTTTVQHINFTGWVNGDSCPDSKEIIDLLTAVQQSQQQSGNGAIVFQCSDGIGRSGCVASIMSVIERVKIEQTVDVFQTIKLIRAKRPGAVNTLDRYVFCYKTILAYLDSFNAYSNFADC